MTNTINFLDLFMLVTMLMPLFAVWSLVASEKQQATRRQKRVDCYAVQEKDGSWKPMPYRSHPGDTRAQALWLGGEMQTWPNTIGYVIDATGLTWVTK